MPWRSSVVKLQDPEPWLSVRTIEQDVRWDKDAQQQLSPQFDPKNGVEKNHRPVFSKNRIRASIKNGDFTRDRVQKQFLVVGENSRAGARCVPRGAYWGVGGEISRVSAKKFFLFDPVYARICVKKDLGKPTQSSHISCIIQT